MVLMPRDVAVLELIARFRRLLLRQIVTLAGFGSLQTASFRLQRLWQHGYVERDFWHVAVGSAPAVYRIGKRGARALAAHSDSDLVEEGVVKATQDHYFLDHTLAVNDVLIAFEVAASKAGHRAIWSIPTKPLDRLPDPSQASQAVPILPDATILYVARGRKLLAFLEVDRGTESARRVAAKMRGYMAYLASGNYQRQFSLHSFRLLIVTPGEKRQGNLQTAVASTVEETAPRLSLDAASVTGMIWWAVQENVTAAAVLDAVWTTNGSRAPFVPAHLAPT